MLIIPNWQEKDTNETVSVPRKLQIIVILEYYDKIVEQTKRCVPSHEGRVLLVLHDPG